MKLSIQNKLIIGLVPPLFFMLLIGAVGYFSMNYALNTIDQLVHAELTSPSATATGSVVLPQAQLQQTLDKIENIHSTANVIVLLDILVAVLGGLGFAYIFARLLSRPIVILSEGAQRIGDGDFDHRLQLGTGDEFEALAGSFNRMAEHVQTAYHSLEQRVAERTRELETLNQIIFTVNRLQDLPEIYRFVLETTLNFTGLNHGGIWILDDGEFVLQAQLRMPPDFVNRRVKFVWAQNPVDRQLYRQTVPEPSAGLAFMPNFPWLRPSTNGAGPVPVADFGPQVVEPAGGNSGADFTLLAIPIHSHRDLVGVMGLASANPRQVFPQHSSTLHVIGQQVGVAVENVRLLQQERRQKELADTLRRVSRSLVDNLELNSVLSKILETIGNVLIVDAGTILLREGDFFRVAAVRGRAKLDMDRWLDYTFPVEANPDLQQAVSTRQPLSFCPPNRVNLFETGIDRLEAVQWCLVVPLLAHNRVIGLLTLEQLGHCYQQVEETRTAFAFANHAALAIENARLYTEVQRFNALLETEVMQRTQQLSAAKTRLEEQAQQLRALYNQTVQAEEVERNRIAQEIHDGITQWVLGALYELEAARIRWNKQPQIALEKVQHSQEVLKRVKTEMYRIIHNLHPPLLESDGLPVAIKTHLIEYQNMAGLPCSFVSHGAPHRLPIERELAVYRIVQEALHNAADHGKATAVQVNLSYTNTWLTAQVSDNGCGFDTSRPVSGDGRMHVGLAGMHERAQAAGGWLNVCSAPGSGTTVSLHIPISDQPDPTEHAGEAHHQRIFSR
ncbi:MAG: HAMP domain-containing protein [Chloroflexi bacterium]|nr:MAG: HAMP domain-containing protein [Chloroflexota bacterium]